jgi:hemolysin activation/secretion protein
VQFDGAAAIAEADLQGLAAPYLQRDVDAGQLRQLAQAVADLYRQRGYFLAQALVPVQQVQDGTLHLSVLEGRITTLDVRVAPQAPISEQRVRAFLAPLLQDAAVTAERYQRAMLLLADQPGIHIGATLDDDKTPGALRLTVQVTPTARWSFALDADNHGIQEYGRYRIGGFARWASPLGVGDNLDLRATLAPGATLVYGRIAYELPLGSSGLRLGAGLARTHYELGGQYAALGLHGTARTWDMSLAYPAIRQPRHNLFLRLLAEQKALHDAFDADTQTARKRIQALGLGWAWERRDDWLGGGYWASAGTLYRGRLTLRDASGLAADQAATGLHTQGDFTKLTLQLSRLQRVAQRHFVFLSLGGQRSSKNLDALEKLALGGAQGVRAYPYGAALVDQGWTATLEWRWSATPSLTPFAFYDAAHGTQDKAPLAPLSAPSLRGAGLGLSWSARHLLIDATLAWRTGTPNLPAQSDTHQPRLYLRAQVPF